MLPGLYANLWNLTKLCECGCGEPAPIAKRTNARYGHVAGQPVRFIRWHHLSSPLPEWIEIDTGYVTPCHVWQRGKVDGYGKLRVNGRMTLAHRHAYKQAGHTLEDDEALDHMCNVRACVREDHLRVLPNAPNTQRGRNAKLTPETVREIRAATGSQDSIALRFGVCQKTISDVKRRKSWGNIP